MEEEVQDAISGIPTSSFWWYIQRQWFCRK